MNCQQGCYPQITDPARPQESWGSQPAFHPERSREVRAEYSQSCRKRCGKILRTASSKLHW